MHDEAAPRPLLGTLLPLGRDGVAGVPLLVVTVGCSGRDRRGTDRTPATSRLLLGWPVLPLGAALRRGC